MLEKLKLLLNIEVWKPVKGYEGLYEISSKGRVKSLANNKTKKEKILKNCIGGRNASTYYQVVLWKDKQNTAFRVHQLVASHFLKKPKTEGYVVDHKDYDRFNNNATNLQYITFRKNLSKNKKGNSKHTGVCWHKSHKTFIANITINGKLKHLGYFKKESDARDAYNKALKELENDTKKRLLD
jgi:hypothetical protein